MSTTLKSLLTGKPTEVRTGDLVRNLVTNERQRFSRVDVDGMIEVMDNDGRVMPDQWHPTQLAAY